MTMPSNKDLLSQLTQQWGTEFGLDLGGEEEQQEKPITTAGKINIMQDYAKVLADSRGGGPQATAVALSFLQENPELVSSLYSNYDIAAPEGMDKFAKVMFELERLGTMGTNLGQKAGSLSQSVTTRTLSPSEAESIFNLELKWQMMAKQAPLEAAKFLAPGFTPEAFAGSHMPGFEEGGVYRNLLPGMNPEMFKYQPTPPGALEEITKMFQPDENEAMQMARAAMENALRTGISSTSTTTSSSSGGGGGGGIGMSPSALMSAYFSANPEARFGYKPPSAPMPGSPLSNIQVPDAGNVYPEAMPIGSSAMLPSLGQQAQQSGSMNPLAQAWSAATGPTNPIAQLFQRMGWR